MGDAGSRYELSKSFVTDNTTVSLMSIVFVLIILLFTFQSVALPILLIIVIQGSIWINFALPTLSGVNVFFMCYLIVSAIQMGANIDYAIVISTRYIDCRKTMHKKDAIIETMNIAFPTVITSGSMMAVAGLLIGRLSSEAIIEGIGKYVGVGTIVTLFLVTLVLPQVLLFGDKIVSATTISIKHHVRDMKKTVLTAVGSLLAAASVFMLIAAPIGLSDVAQIKEEHAASTGTILVQIKNIEDKLSELNVAQETYDKTKFSYAKGVVTDSVGQDRLSEGQTQYDKGAQDLADGQAKYDAAAAKIADAEAQYAAGQQTLLEGKQEYKDGEAKLEDAKQQYAAGEAKLEKVKPIYDAVLPLYNDYQKTLNEYNQASANGNLALVAVLWPQVTAAKALYTTQLVGTGYSVESLIKEYQAGQAQLESGAQQIAAGQAQLDAAAKQIAEGQQKLDAAAKQITDGKQQLAAAKTTLDAGYGKLGDAKAQLDAGKQTLANNKSGMASDLEELKQYDDARDVVENGIAILMQNDEIKDKVGDNATYAEICTGARQYLAQDEKDTAKELQTRQNLYIAAVIGAIMALAAAIFCVGGALTSSLGDLRLCSILSSSALLVSLGLCIKGSPSFATRLADGSGSGSLQFAASAALLVTALICAVGAFWFLRANKRAAAPVGAKAQLGGGEIRTLESDIGAADESEQTIR